jgi:L-histidine N-alpha-methyltransferase
MHRKVRFDGIPTVVTPDEIGQSLHGAERRSRPRERVGVDPQGVRLRVTLSEDADDPRLEIFDRAKSADMRGRSSGNRANALFGWKAEVARGDRTLLAFLATRLAHGGHFISAAGSSRPPHCHRRSGAGPFRNGTAQARPAVVHDDPRFRMMTSGRTSDRKATMAREVRAGLCRVPRAIPPKYFYDEVGSDLFDAICTLPEYYLTRSEGALLDAHAVAIVTGARAASLIEIGSGMARKTGPMIEALCARSPAPTYVPFDIAPDAIRQSAGALLNAYPALRVCGVVGDFARDCAELAVAAPASRGPRIFAFLGSTIGNLDETEAPALLRSVSALMNEHDRFLLGIDLVKSPAVLHAAYNDAQGVTAAFNRNVLRVVARELDGDVDEAAFDHAAFFDPARERVEMHLVSTRAQTLTLRAADVRIDLARGESILTEISRKFTRESAERTLGEGGMQLLEWLTGPDGAFALCVARAVRRA